MLRGSALVTGLVLVAAGTDVLVAVAAATIGVAVGAVAFSLLYVIGGLSFSAEEAGYGAAIGLSEDDEPSRAYVLFGILFDIVPPALTVMATVAASSLVRDVDRTFLLAGIAVAGAGLCAWLVVGAIVSARNAAEAAASEVVARKRWLTSREASASADPEFKAALEQEGWRADGRYDDMRAAYFRAWERVKERRRAEGRPIFRRADSATGNEEPGPDGPSAAGGG